MDNTPSTEIDFASATLASKRSRWNRATGMVPEEGGTRTDMRSEPRQILSLVNKSLRVGVGKARVIGNYANGL